MSFTYYECAHCHRATFPRRRLCARCGHGAFDARTLLEAQVCGYTEAHRRPAEWPYPYLVELRAERQDLNFLAVSRFAPAPGETVKVLLSATGLAHIER
ncbi:MAG: hypothetical protein ACODTU_00305 [Pigmentiphaga sp.]|uniref:DUF35 domain-containing protein n=1 Tax=Pigmentiphaga daeguensis TaxID=414049 RepID=A0ABN1D3P8_9BURK